MKVWFKTAKDGRWTITNKDDYEIEVVMGITRCDDKDPTSNFRLMTFYFFRWSLIFGWERSKKEIKS